MTIFEKIKIWCKLTPRREVRIYALLGRLAKALKNTGLLKAAEQLDDILSWEFLPDDILGSASSVLRQIRHSGKLPPALGWRIRMALSAMQAIRWNLFRVSSVDCTGHGKANAEIYFVPESELPRPANIRYADDCIVCKLNAASLPVAWRVSADTLTCAVEPQIGRLLAINAYTPQKLLAYVPELNMPIVAGFSKVFISANYDTNGIAPLFTDPGHCAVWEYSPANGVLRAVFGSETEELHAVTPNLVIGIRHNNELSEIRFGGVWVSTAITTLKSDGADGDDSVDNPLWEEIESAIYALNTDDKTLISLTAGDAGVMLIGGGNGQYLVTVIYSDEIHFTAGKPEMNPKEVEFTVGGQTGVYSSNQIVDLASALHAARCFVNFGMRDSKLEWTEP